MEGRGRGIESGGEREGDREWRGERGIESGGEREGDREWRGGGGG